MSGYHGYCLILASFEAQISFIETTQAKETGQMETVTVYNRDKTKTFEATVLGRHEGLIFVEHPTQGDAEPIMVLQKDGTLNRSHAWDMETVYSGDY